MALKCEHTHGHICKPAAKQMRTNARNHCRRGTSHPCEHCESEGTKGPACAQNLDLHHVKNRAMREQERVVEVQSEGMREGEQMGQPSGGWSKSKGDKKKEGGCVCVSVCEGGLMNI